MLRKKDFVFLVTLIAVLLVSSCSDVGTNISSVMTASKDTLTTVPENIPTPTLLSTEAKPTLTPLLPIKVQCVGNSAEVPKFDLSGVVALHTADKPDGFEFGFYLLDLKSRNTIRTIDDGMFMQVSPDGNYLAYEYLRGDTGFLSILNSNGKIIADFESKSNGLRIDYFNWQNPEKLRVLHEGMGDKLSAQLLNPFIQEGAHLKTDWSGVYAPRNPFQDKLVQWKFDQHATEFVMYMVQTSCMIPALRVCFIPKMMALFRWWMLKARQSLRALNSQTGVVCRVGRQMDNIYR